jgi:protein-serine/threonine kinase
VASASALYFHVYIADNLLLSTEPPVDRTRAIMAYQQPPGSQQQPQASPASASGQSQQQQSQQQQLPADPNSAQNRLHLNFGFTNSPNFAAEQGRAFPTTPSTFPQPFPNAAGQQEVWGAQPASSGINSQGYFYNSNPAAYQQQFANASPAAGYRSPGGFDQMTNGLAHQFQHQNLGGNTPRSASPYNRQPSPANARPRTAGATTSPGYSTYLSAPVPQMPPQPSIYDDEPPVKNSEKYSSSITERMKVQKLLTQEFFRENVERARARNERYAGRVN